MQGLHTEYERLRLEADGGSESSKATGSTELAALKASLQASEKSKQEVEVCSTLCIQITPSSILAHLFRQVQNRKDVISTLTWLSLCSGSVAAGSKITENGRVKCGGSEEPDKGE